MNAGYALAYVNPSGQERLLIKGLTESGSQHISIKDARELSDRLCLFASVDDIQKFLQGDSSVRPIRHVPYIFRLDPEEDKTFRVYQVMAGRISDSPEVTIRCNGNDITKQ